MSKECPVCHAMVEDTATVCPYCGATLSTELGWEDPVFWTNPAPVDNNGYPSSAAKGLTIALAVFCFISAASMLLLTLIAASLTQFTGEMELMEEYAELFDELSTYLGPVALLAIVDAVFYTVFGILLLIKKNWKIALTITIYSSVWYVLGMIGGSSSGIPILPLLGVLATVWLRKTPERNL